MERYGYHSRAPKTWRRFPGLLSALSSLVSTPEIAAKVETNDDSTDNDPGICRQVFGAQAVISKPLHAATRSSLELAFDGSSCTEKAGKVTLVRRRGFLRGCVCARVSFVLCVCLCVILVAVDRALWLTNERTIQPSRPTRPLARGQFVSLTLVSPSPSPSPPVWRYHRRGTVT